jgi:hypothetical protein
LLDGYARSVVRLSRDVDTGSRTQKQSDAINTFVVPLLLQRQYPILSSIMTGAQYTFDESPVDDVEFGLDCIFDGIDRLVTGRKP